MPAKSAVSPQYIAGFLDGEGCVTVRESNKYSGRWSFQPVVSFTNRDIRPLLAIKALYGGGIYSKGRYSPKHAQAFELIVFRRAGVHKLLCAVQPYLLIKERQVSLALGLLGLGRARMRIVGHRRIHPVKGGTHPVLSVVPGEREFRAQVKRQMMQLNARGPLCLQ